MNHELSGDRTRIRPETTLAVRCNQLKIVGTFELVPIFGQPDCHGVDLLRPKRAIGVGYDTSELDKEVSYCRTGLPDTVARSGKLPRQDLAGDYFARVGLNHATVGCESSKAWYYDSRASGVCVGGQAEFPGTCQRRKYVLAERASYRNKNQDQCSAGEKAGSFHRVLLTSVSELMLSGNGPVQHNDWR